MPMNLEVDGAGRLVDALSKFNKEIYKILQDDVRAAAGLVAEDARRRTPAMVLYGGNGERRSNGWGTWTSSGNNPTKFGSRGTAAGRDLSYNEGRIDKSIRPGARKARVRGAGSVGIKGIVTMNDVGGQIWATAGAENDKDSQFNRDIIARWGSDYPRGLKAALFAKGPEAGEMMDRAIERAEREFRLI
jgi:hypothetical protein